ncbi:MAG TPA: DUF1700 domain-containing protein [Stellaceae bacterium]|jgi:uncharacterized membrane protein|nr:DUF1700 domain-containing protein [Stellaceae bacterium]
MNKADFLDLLCRRLAGMPESEIDEIIADYARHFDDGIAAGRSEEEIARALGDPMRLARELRAEAGFRRWEQSRTPANFAAAVFGFVALVAVDFVFLLPFLATLAFFTLIGGLVAVVLCLVGLALVTSAGFLGLHSLARAMAGLGLLGFGVGGGALLVILVDCVVRLLGKYARLHYTLLRDADPQIDRS